MSDSSQVKPFVHKRSRRWKRWLLLFCGGLFSLLLFEILLPSENGSHSSPKLHSANNLKQIGLAIELYAKDNSGHYPDRLGALLLNEDITSAVFVSPGSKDTPATGPTPEAVVANLTDGGHLSYVYLGRGLTDKAADDVVVAYEDPNIWPTGTNVLYADGHVQFDPSDRVRRLAAKAADGEFPVTMPTDSNNP